MKVRDVMASHVIEVRQTDTCERAAQLMREHRTGSLVVVTREDVIAGVVTDRDLVVECVALGRDPKEQEVGQCVATDYANMSHPATVEANMELEEAVDLMEKAGVHRLPVTEDGVHCIGILSLDDIAEDVRHYLNAFLAVAGQYHRKR